MAAAMDTDDVIAFLTGQPARTAKVATVRSDGRPHVVPVWFVLDAATADRRAPTGDFVFTTGSGTVKGRNLRRDRRASLCVDDDRPPFTFVTIEGMVSISEDADELGRWSRTLGGRYMGTDRADEFGRRNAVPGELLVRLRPSRIVAIAGLSN